MTFIIDYCALNSVVCCFYTLLRVLLSYTVAEERSVLPSNPVTDLPYPAPLCVDIPRAMIIIRTFVEAHSKYRRRKEEVETALADTWMILRSMRDSFTELCKYRAEVNSLADAPPSADAAVGYLTSLIEGVRLEARLGSPDKPLTTFICHQLAPRATVIAPRGGAGSD